MFENVLMEIPELDRYFSEGGIFSFENPTFEAFNEFLDKTIDKVAQLKNEFVESMKNKNFRGVAYISGAIAIIEVVEFTFHGCLTGGALLPSLAAGFYFALKTLFVIASVILLLASIHSAIVAIDEVFDTGIRDKISKLLKSFKKMFVGLFNNLSGKDLKKDERKKLEDLKNKVEAVS